MPLSIGVTAKNAIPGRRWSVADIIEVRRIVSIALAEDGRTAAFILKESFLGTGRIRYGLYQLNIDRGESARRLTECDFLADATAHPHQSRWTVRADFGHGVQLYDIDGRGEVFPVLTISDPVTIGGYHGVIPSATEPARSVGVLAYGWASDGAALWYSRLRVHSGAEQTTWKQGITYDARTMSSLSFASNAGTGVDAELHVITDALQSDRMVTAISTAETSGIAVFTPTTTRWTTGSRRLEYMRVTVAASGERNFGYWSIDTSQADVGARKEREVEAMEALYGVRLPDGQGYLTVRADENRRRLVAIDAKGQIVRDFGPVPFIAVGPDFGVWWDRSGSAGILGVRYGERDGLMHFPMTIQRDRISEIADHLSLCAFDRDLTIGACVRESLTRAPELVAVSPGRGSLKVAARPNAQYDSIEPLHSDHVTWTNRYGSVSDGYVTYPRAYLPGRTYPALVVTHRADAQNRFAYEGFQWEYPIQVFAEVGYVVLSVNEAVVNAKTRVAVNAWASMSTGVGIADMQFALGRDAVATMEAAAEWAVSKGLVNAAKIGIAGYSRGSHVAKFCLSLSNTFAVGSAGDASWFSASGYWDSGQLAVRNLYRSVFGGSPFDESTLKNYREFSPSFRAQKFSGPLLQQFTAANASTGLELDALLRDAGVPTELVYYSDETHVLWQPNRRASAMGLNIDWFNYWLLGTHADEPEKFEQYARWDGMRSQWKSPNRSLGASAR